MTIKEARQSGSSILVKYGVSTTRQLTGKLVGFTQKAVYLISGNNLQIFYEENNNLRPSGKSIQLNGGEPMMYGNFVGIKTGRTVKLYDEKGNSAGVKNI